MDRNCGGTRGRGQGRVGEDRGAIGVHCMPYWSSSITSIGLLLDALEVAVEEVHRVYTVHLLIVSFRGCQTCGADGQD